MSGRGRAGRLPGRPAPQQPAPPARGGRPAAEPPASALAFRVVQAVAVAAVAVVGAMALLTVGAGVGPGGLPWLIALAPVTLVALGLTLTRHPWTVPSLLLASFVGFMGLHGGLVETVGSGALVVVAFLAAAAMGRP